MSSRPQRLRLLLYLEWSLLACIAIGESVQGFSLLPRWPLLNGLGLLLFGLLGLRLPQRKHTQLLYVSLEVCLLLVTSLLGGLRLIGLWFVVIVIRNSQFLHRPYRLGVTVLAFGFYAALQFHRRNTLEGLSWSNLNQDQLQRLWIVGMLVYGLSLFILQVLVDTLLAEYNNRHQLSIANSQIREYASQIETLATSQERNRIAQDIHDALGHSLTALNIHLEAVEKLWPIDSAQAHALLKEAQQLATLALEDVRLSVSALRSDPLADLSLAEAIESLLEEIRRTQTVEIQTDIVINKIISSSVKIAVYRIMQEAFTNILKHADATIITLKVQNDMQLKVLIQDNGKGFEAGQNTTGFGLQSMQERAYALNGGFEIMTSPGRGCKILISIPLENKLHRLDSV